MELLDLWADTLVQVQNLHTGHSLEYPVEGSQTCVLCDKAFAAVYPVIHGLANLVQGSSRLLFDYHVVDARCSMLDACLAANLCITRSCSNVSPEQSRPNIDPMVIPN